MNLFSRIKIRERIIGIILIMALFMSTLGLMGYYYTNKMADGMKTMYNDNLLSVKRLNETRHNFRAVHGMILELMLGNVDNNKREETTAKIKALASETDATIKEYENQQLTSYEREQLAKLHEGINLYRAERQKAIYMAQAGQTQAAYTYFSQNAASQLNKVNDLLKDLADHKATASQAVASQGQKDVAFANTILTIVTIVALLLSSVLGWRLANMIARRLQTVGTVLNEVAKGNISVSEVRIVSDDEIGQIGKDLNLMIGNLSGLIKQVSQSAEQVAASAEELTASAEQSAQAANQVAISISQVSQGTDKQVNVVKDAVVVVEQMSDGIKQVAVNANTVAATSDKTADTAQAGGRSINTAISQMENIERTVLDSAQVVIKLGERSQEIGQIVDTISGIAGQTNLLALNAAIEAARAGEQGRGFAVVAEEVRKLAEQSQEAAKQISALISEIQGDTGKAVEAMDAGTREVKVGAEVVNAAGRAFNDIVTLVKDVSIQVKEISAASQQLASGSQQLVAAVYGIDNISKENAAETQTVSAATEEQSASMEEIAASSQNLAKMAFDLQSAVTKFKI